jgi:putative ABC transport system ATP-binding protein
MESRHGNNIEEKMDLIEVKEVSKNYQLGETTVHALTDINLSIRAGEFVAICGPSGSGKTTLLNLIGSIDSPGSGQIFFDAQDIGQLSDNRQTELRNHSMGFIFQNFNLIPVLTALENVMLPLRITGMSVAKSRKKALKRLCDVELEHIAAHRPDKMSGGQQQRVAIARALIANPSLVIADEPTANLDSVTAKAIIDLMQDLNRKEQTTFVFSTHDQRLLDRVQRNVTLKDGRIDGGKNNV